MNDSSDHTPLRYHTAVEPDRVVVAVRSDIDMASVAEFRDVLDAALAHGRTLVVDLAECNYLDSTGISALVGVKNAKRDLQVVASRHVARIFDLVGLTSFLNVTPAA